MPVAPEHIPTLDKVNAYLTSRAQGDLCQDVMNCNSWPAEAFLMDDLARYVNNEPPLPKATRAETRLYLRATSWFLYTPLPDETLLAHIDRLPMLSADDRALFHTAIGNHLQDEALEPATQRIDTLYTKAWAELQRARRNADLPWRDMSSDALPAPVLNAKANIEVLRPLRDTLYFRRHLSHWLAWQGQ